MTSLTACPATQSRLQSTVETAVSERDGRGTLEVVAFLVAMIAVAPPPSPLVQPTKRKHGGRVPPIVTAADALTRLDALDPHGMMSGEEEKFESPSATLSIAPRRELGAGSRV